MAKSVAVPSDWEAFVDRRLSLPAGQGEPPPGGWPRALEVDGHHRYHRLAPGAGWGVFWSCPPPDPHQASGWLQDTCSFLVWEVSTGHLLASVPGRGFQEPTYLDDDRLLVVGRGVHLVTRHGAVQLLDDQATEASLSPDGNLLAMTSCSRGRLWNLETGRVEAHWKPEMPPFASDRASAGTLIWWHPTRPLALEGYLYDVCVEGRYYQGISEQRRWRHTPSFQKAEPWQVLA